MSDNTGASPGSPVADSSQAPVSPTTEDTANANPAKQDEASTQAIAEKKFKLKFGKQEREMTEKELITHAQKGWASDEKFQQAAKASKEVDEFLNRMKSDDGAFDEFIKFLGKDPDDIYKKRLGESLKKKVMTPEQRELEEMRNKVKKFEEGEKSKKEAEHKKHMEELQTKYEQQYDKEMSDAIMKSGLPKTPRTVKRIAEVMYKSLKNGYDLPWDIAVSVAKEEYQNDLKEMFGSADGESLVKLFGDDVAKKFNKASLQKRTIDPEPVTKENQSPARAKDRDNTPKYVSEDEFEEKMKKWKNG
jgi:hypothetical protein